MKKVYILAYSKMNLGDDIFIDMLVKRYKHIQFYSKNMRMDSYAYKENANLHFIDYTLDELVDLADFDAFVYIGGSIFMEHAGGIERIEKLKELAIKCNHLGIPFYYISSNFGPYQTEDYKTLVAEMFGEVTDVCLRDKSSFEIFNNIPTVRYAPDAVLAYCPPKVEKEKNTIGISVINFKFREKLKNYEQKYYEILLKSIEHYIQKGFKVKLFSFCKYEGDEDTAQLLIDKVSKKKSVELITYNGNIKEFLKKYGKVEYMICSRFHSMILSYILKQKSYILSYSNKITNVIKDLNLINTYQSFGDINNIDYISIDSFKDFNYNDLILSEANKQFAKLDEQLLKTEPDEKVTVIIPARNEEKTIQKVIKLVQKNPLVSQIIVVDNNSLDHTAKLASNAGAQVVFCPEQGKGYAMEEGLKFSVNDVVVFIDADISNYSKDLINKLSEPVLNKKADFVKSMFDRTGGRVTELVAKPMLEVLFPDMYKFSQPLSGMIAGRKTFFEQIVFEKDYGVDIGILLDMVNINARIKEVHIGTIKNVSQQWQSLEKMSREVIKAIIKRANY